METSTSSSIVIDCPSRIDFTGGFTDVVPFRDFIPAYHINAALDLRISVILQTRKDRQIHIVSSEATASHNFKKYLNVDTPRALVASVLGKIPIPHGLNISIHSDAPIGAGLGTSGALSIALLAGLQTLYSGKKVTTQLGSLAMEAANTENEVGILGGCQDQFAAAFGSLNRFSFYRNSWEIFPFNLSLECKHKLEQHLILACPGGNRLSSDIVTRVLSAYQKGDRKVSYALYTLNRYSPEIEAALTHTRFKELSALMREIRNEQQKLCPSIIDQRTSRIIKELEMNHRVGAKILGGGGPNASILIVCEKVQARPAVSAFLKEQGYSLLPAKIAKKGLQIKIKKYVPS